jgi:hypothetical protein
MFHDELYRRGPAAQSFAVMSNPLGPSERPGELLPLELFQQCVLEILAAQFPQLQFRGGDEPGVICFGEHQMGLGNLYARYQLAGVAGAELKDFVCGHFGNLVDVAPPPEGKPLAPWREARRRLRPQLMPESFTNRLPLVHFPFHAGLAIGVVLDEPKRYAYVRREDLAAWHKTAEQVYQRALDNLDEAMRDVKIHASHQPARVLAIETRDGYDAARILLPSLRVQAVEFLGQPFFAGLPNRDFLILWSRRCSPGFHQAICRQLEADAERQSHPLAAVPFEVTVNSIRPASGG